MLAFPFATSDDLPDELLADADLLDLLDEADGAYFTFRPRPDQPERYDRQTAFLESRTRGVKILLGGNGAGTTTTCVRAMARFLMETPPPRRDTPFWVVAPTLEQAMKTVWGEKICALGHLPMSEVDHERVAWFKPRENMPFTVPLREWPDRPGKNWSIGFRGWSSGRAALQAQSIGGFLFVEQFPFEMLMEVRRGCREYNYPGAQLVEFTPIDPNIGPELLEMIENDALPAGWETYYLNTECAAEAGHVNRAWFDDFFAMVPEAMRATRMTGRLPKWEGIIYDGFNPAIHVVGDERIIPGGRFPDSAQHRRAIDWGAGPENPFVCLWLYKNPVGQWHAYDEYYSTEPITVAEHLKAVADRHPWPEGHSCYGTTYADPSGTAFIRIAHKLPLYCPGTKRIPITAASNDVLPGIEYVQHLLELDPALATPEYPAGQPRLLIHREACPKLIGEFRKYRWQKGSKLGTNAGAPTVAPVKKDDHCADALRYATFTERQHTMSAPSGAGTIEAGGGRHGVQLDRGSRRGHGYGRGAV